MKAEWPRDAPDWLPLRLVGVEPIPKVEGACIFMYALRAVCRLSDHGNRLRSADLTRSG